MYSTTPILRHTDTPNQHQQKKTGTFWLRVGMLLSATVLSASIVALPTIAFSQSTAVADTAQTCSLTDPTMAACD